MGTLARTLASQSSVSDVSRLHSGIGDSVFVGERLSIARNLRGQTATALAVASGVSPEWISKVERGRTVPSLDLVESVARTLRFPADFFFREVAVLPPSDDFHFRASSKLAQKDKSAARGLSLLAWELSDWMDETYRLPAPGVPELQDFADADVNTEPDVAAEAARNYWGLGSAPISNMMALMEAKGARVFSVNGTYKAIDAFSFRHRENAIIFLNPTKSAERLRFDLAHELGHLILHGGSLRGNDRKAREREANDFASAFLMPRSGVIGSVRGNVTMDDLLLIRRKWKVSAMALTVRLNQLDLISDWMYRLLCQDLAKKGFRRREPGSTLVREGSTLWPQILADLRGRGEGITTLASLVGVRASDIRSLLAGFVPLAIPGQGERTVRAPIDLRVIEGAAGR
jgi:Zn-dependent peptidase ImmA (M78 family)/transcriptional regulator with XRE-family HTH domain